MWKLFKFLVLLSFAIAIANWYMLKYIVYSGTLPGEPVAPAVMYTIDVSHDMCDSYATPNTDGTPIDYAASYERLYIIDEGPHDWIQFRRNGRNEWVSRACVLGR